MSNRATSWAIEIPDLPPTTKLVLLLLADCHNGGTGQCNPSPEWLSERAGMKERAIQMHLRKLEELGLLERQYEYHGRGKGCSVSQYNLKLGIISKPQALQPHLIEPQNNAPAKTCARKKTSMRPQKMVHHIEPELEPESITAHFEEIWKAWSTLGRRRSKSKAKTLEMFKRVSKQHNPKTIRLACVAYAKATDGQYHKNLPEFLRDGYWENWIGRDMSEQPKSHTDDDWERWLFRWNVYGEWNCPDSPSPDQPGCKMPQKFQNQIKKRRAV
jgi:predicted transcriptional regulator